MENFEYRVRPVVRYILTEYHSGTKPDGMCFGGSRVIGEFQTEECADRVCAAMQLGWGYGGQPPAEGVNPAATVV